MARHAFFAEVVRDSRMAAVTHLGVGHHLPQPRIRVVLQRCAILEPGLLDEEGLEVAVRRAVQKRALRRPPVASRPSGLLVVGLQAARQVVVDDAADVGDVHAHAEGRRRDHHHRAPLCEVFLDPAPQRRILLAVIANRAQVGRHLLCRLDCAHIDKRTLPRSGQQPAQLFALGTLATAPDHRERQRRQQ